MVPFQCQYIMGILKFLLQVVRFCAFSNLTRLGLYFNNSLWSRKFGREQGMTSSEVGFRVLGIFGLSLGEIGQNGRGLYFVCVLDKINVAIVNNFCFNGMQCN